MSEFLASKAPWLASLPAGWVAKPLRFSLECNDGGAWGTDPAGQDDTVVLRSTEQTVDGHWSIEEPAYRNLKLSEHAATCLKVGDLLVTKSSGSATHIGKTTLVDEAVASLRPGYSNFMQRLRATDDANSKFIWYLLNSKQSKLQINLESTTSTGLTNLSGGLLGRLVFAFPTFDAQTAIVSYLDVETERIDALIAEKKLLVNALAELKKSVVLEAITTGVRRNQNFAESGLSWVNKIPKHWKTASLKRCVRLVGGHTPSTTNLAYWDGAVPWFSPKDMKSDELEDSIDHVTDAAVLETGLSIIEPGTTMIVVRGMILAHTFPVCVTKVQGTLNQDMKALVPDETLDKLYLPWLLRGVASLFLSLTDQSGHGTMALRTDRFMSERLPIPPLDEQLEIVAHLEAQRLRIDQLLAHVLTELDLLAELRSSTITDAVLGRIDVRTSVQNRKELEAA